MYFTAKDVYIYMNDSNKLGLNYKPLLLMTGILPAAAVACLVGAFFADGGSKLILIGAAAVFLLLLIPIFKQIGAIKQANKLLEALEENIPDLRYLVFNASADTAVVPEEFCDIANITRTPESTCGKMVFADRDRYVKLLSALTADPSDEFQNVYRSPLNSERWYSVVTFDAGYCSYTIITDATDKVHSRDMIRDLRSYDSTTKLLSYEAFTEALAAVTAKGLGCCVVQFHINGLERITSVIDYAAAERVLISISDCLKSFVSNEIIAGRRNSNEFVMLINGPDHDSVKNMVSEICSRVNKNAAQCSDELKLPVYSYCGYCLCPEQASELNSILSAADFAAFEAESAGSSIPQKFNPVSFEKRQEDYRRIQVFDDLISGNEIDYWFQPIVDARTGEIHGYESLMRPRTIEGVKFTPFDVLTLAQEQNMLDEIERLTFFNTITKVYENQDLFKDRKVFLNSIPSCCLSENDYNYLLENYVALFDYLVIEITESSEMSLKTIEKLRERFVSHKSLIALDDYGTGYSNESNLLKSQPNYIKIDRSLLTGIDSNAQKQHLVSNMINFASKHDIKVIAEGIETAEELETVINLDVDLIQGFFTCRPQAVILREISADVKELIAEINLRRKRGDKKVFEVADNETVDCTKAALSGFTDILITGRRATVTSKSSRCVPISITIPRGINCDITFDNISIEGLDRPAVMVEEGAVANISINGKNHIKGEGIRVPKGARVLFIGDGELDMECDVNGKACIGGGASEDFGEIVMNMTGDISVSANCDASVGIGGGLADGSTLKLVQGNVKIRTTGEKTVGMGFYKGNGIISLIKGTLDIESCGATAVGLGVMKGNISLESCVDLKVTCSGDSCACVGAHNGSTGIVQINSGNVAIDVKSKEATGIGGVGANLETIIHSGSVSVHGEGGMLYGLGDSSGDGTLTIESGYVNLFILSANGKAAGVANGKTVIFGGNIVSNTIDDIQAVGPYDLPLKMHRIKCSGPFNKEIKSSKGTYSYVAENDENLDELCIYLPEDAEVV